MSKTFIFSTLKYLIIVFAINSAHAYVANPKERISFWRENFTSLTKHDHPHVEKAHSIFKKLVNVAGNRNGITPMLHIVDVVPDHIPLPMAIPDGWIIISRNTLDFAYETPEKGNDILAFILAHEIAHQMEDDFWHMKYFQAIDNYKVKSNEKQLTEIQSLAAQSNKMIAKELRADEQGLTISAMAGFNTKSVLDNESKGNFFRRWINRFSDNKFTSSNHSTTHPSPQQRELAIHSRLKQIHQQSKLFSLGLWQYQAGHYNAAKNAFEEFRHYFPGRAVNHNIALCYHQLALQALPITNYLDFRTTLSLDPYTSASQVDRSARPVKNESHELLNNAIELYKLAISQDKNYISAYNNLASAYLKIGEHYKAIGLLLDAIKIKPDDTRLLNNLSIAFFKADRKDKSRQLLNKALSIDSANTDILYNLGFYHLSESNTPEARKYWGRFLEIEPHSGWSKQVQKKLKMTYKPLLLAHTRPENINHIQIGHYLDELPSNWKLDESNLFVLNNHSYKLSSYKNGILSITEEDEIIYIVAEGAYPGKTNNGVKINDSVDYLISKYGSPDEIQYTSTGTNMIYRDNGISFQIRDYKINSWLLFRS